MGGPALVSSAEQPAHVMAYGETGALPVIGVPVVEAAPVVPQGLTFWTQALGAWGRIRTDGNAASAKHDLGGFFSGVDTLVLDG